MAATIPLLPGKIFHIYNRGINGGTLFFNNCNYIYFIELCRKHILPVTKIYAWCLLQNHFHFLVQIKEENELTPGLNLTGSQNLSGFFSKKFSNLFNAYTKAVNKQLGRTGSLFERAFHRIPVENEVYLRNLVVYIHKNPLHHYRLNDPGDYLFSSYQGILQNNDKLADGDMVIDLFDDNENFVFMHRNNSEKNLLEEFKLE